MSFVIVLQVGQRIFGGYSGTPWNQNSTRFGTPKSFLFSLTFDVKVPYKGQKAGVSCCLWAADEAITWGMVDLYFKDGFCRCGSKLESNYSLDGAYPANEGPDTLLAGASQFSIADGLIVEVWGFVR